MTVQTIADLKTAITNNITTNGNGDITGAQLRSLLTDVVDTLESMTPSAALWQDVVFINSSDSPYDVQTTDAGKIIAVDTSAGNVVVNLTTVNAAQMIVGIKKDTSDVNTVTVNRNGDNLILPNDTTSKVITAENETVVFLSTDDVTPNKWNTTDY